MTNDSEQIVVTGSGIICSIGTNKEEVFLSLKEKRSGIKIHNFQWKGEAMQLPFAAINQSNDQLRQQLGLENSSIYSRTTLIGILAAKQALKESNIRSRSALRGGLVSSTTVGGMDLTEDIFNSIQSSDTTNWHKLKAHDSGYCAECIANELQLCDFVTTISTACSSAANAVQLGAKLLLSNNLDYVVVGGTDALTRFTTNGFRSLMIYDEDLCKPWDNQREGLNLGEGAAYLVLQRKSDVDDSKVQAIVSGYANANDAFHQTASSSEGEGAYLAMKGALNLAGLTAEQIGYVNVHGTGTENNDASETIALERIFANSEKPPVPVSTTKSYTGHTLAAAGSIEAVISVIAIQNQIIPANLRLKDPILNTVFKVVREPMQKKVSHILSNSFGFGGNCTTLILSSLN